MGGNPSTVKGDIAKQYDGALSGREGPEARMDAIIELAQGEVQTSMDSMVFSSAGGTNISGFNGMFTVDSAPPGGGRSAPSSGREANLPRVPWSLRYDSEDEEFYLRYPGKVFWGFGDIDEDSEVTISDLSDEVDVQSDGGVWLHLTNLDQDTPTLSLGSGDFWTEHPKTFKEEDVDYVNEVTEAWFPLWTFHDGTLPEEEYGVQITEDVWGRQIARSANSVMIWGVHNPDSDNTRMAVPVLVPLA